ncbi:hypothetical protein ETD86_40960 [Nonomuraea turkmeniaca]|uniref:Uncharacterized protein n=1 Tax=Nonomuraea turkmeniaca TaxID=103838 RepID=A0A5S4F2I8_9ACTN|nr:hypothetical protein [Nonomuraea turkmeniaca]TMR10098.1 hypothetical protein ETD86_40960 [Nonomuraea turkmeniaca]
MAWQEHRIVPVRYVGGPLDGDVNALDYADHELQEMADQEITWDYTPGDLSRDADDVVERYRPEHRPDGWAFVHVGTFERPVEDRPFTAVFVGGLRDGEQTTFLASIRDRVELATSHHPGYRLVHEGDDILTGWQMMPIEG